VPKRKLKKYAENETFEHLIQPSYEEIEKGLKQKGIWALDYFGNKNPIILELGCGKGEYTIGLAELYPDKNFIGVDIKGARLWAGCKKALEKGLTNTVFLRTEIGMIDHCFGKNEIAEIWLTFPDPQPKKRNEKKRLTSSRYLSKYKGLISKEGIIHLKTDNLMLYNHTLEIIDSGEHKLHYATSDLYHSDCTGDVKHIKTYYEQQFLEEGLLICYLKFSLKKNES